METRREIERGKRGRASKPKKQYEAYGGMDGILFLTCQIPILCVRVKLLVDVEICRSASSHVLFHATCTRRSPWRSPCRSPCKAPGEAPALQSRANEPLSFLAWPTTFSTSFLAQRPQTKTLIQLNTNWGNGLHIRQYVNTSIHAIDVSAHVR